jgi:tetratricopeptide (TPR) repeat protein
MRAISSVTQESDQGPRTRPGAGLLLRSALIALALLPAPLAGREAAVEALNRQGIQHYEERRYHQAIESFEKALQLEPTSAELRSNLSRAWTGLGVEYLGAGEHGQAMKAFERSLAIEEDFYALFGIGFILYLEQDLERAREHLVRALARTPDFSKAHKILGLIEYRRGREKEAIERMEKATALDRSDEEARLILERWKEEGKVAGRFQEFRTRRFTVRHDPKIPAAAAADLARHLEAAADAIGDSLGRRPADSLVVVLFDEEGFRRATGTYHWIGGIFDGQIKIPVAVKDGRLAGSREDRLRGLQHELTHALVREIYPGCPNWLNEGIAQFFELLPVGDVDAEGERRAGERRAERRRRIEEDLRQNRARRTPFAKIPSRLWEVSSEPEARWSYVQGLGFVEFLAGKHLVFRLRLLLETARKERSLQRAVELTYGKSLEALEEAWWGSLGAAEGSRDSRP